MGIRKEIFICAAALSIMACTACGSSEGNVSGTNGVETSTGGKRNDRAATGYV